MFSAFMELFNFTEDSMRARFSTGNNDGIIKSTLWKYLPKRTSNKDLPLTLIINENRSTSKALSYCIAGTHRLF